MQPINYRNRKNPVTAMLAASAAAVIMADDAFVLDVAVDRHMPSMLISVFFHVSFVVVEAVDVVVVVAIADCY